MAKLEQQQARQRAGAAQQQPQQPEQAVQPQQVQQQAGSPAAADGEAVPGLQHGQAGQQQEPEQAAVGEQLVGRAVSKRFGSKFYSGAGWVCTRCGHLFCTVLLRACAGHFIGACLRAAVKWRVGVSG